MSTIRSLRTFVRVVELGSLTATAREQGTTQPTVSKLVAALERELDVRLLDRATTRVTPTDQGRRFYERAKRVIEEFGEAVMEAKGLTQKPAGLLRVNVPVSIGVVRLNALMLEFLSMYPDIDVEMIFNDRFIDVVEEGVDLALRIGGTLPLNVVARPVATSRRYLVAAPSYIEANAAIRRPADLINHQYLRFAWLPAGDKVTLFSRQQQVTVTMPGRYRVNSSLAIRESLGLGKGIGLAPGWLVQDLLDSGNLVRVLPRWSGETQNAFLLYPSRRYQPLRLKVLIQFLSSRIPGLPGFSPAGAV
jgi:DNA-binding transcriptional LysR family regulator